MRKVIISLVMSVRPSLRQHGTPWLPLGIFSLNLIFEFFRKALEKIQVPWKFGKNSGYFTWKPMHISYHFFNVYVTVHRNKFLFNKTNRCTNFPNLFCQESLHVSGISSAHLQEFSTVHSALVYVMQLWRQLSSTTRMVVLESCHQSCMTYTSAECTVEDSLWWAEELPETCRDSWQNKFGKLVHLLVLVKRNSSKSVSASQ